MIHFVQLKHTAEYSLAKVILSQDFCRTVGENTPTQPCSSPSSH